MRNHLSKNGAGRMKIRRRRMKMSQENLAALIGVDQGTLSRWESGTQAPLRALRIVWENELARAERARRRA